MTKVCFTKNRQGVITGFTAEDHSGYAEAGEDIVCAAVSALVIHTVNSIDRFTDDQTEEEQDEKNAWIRLQIIGEPDEKAELFLKSLEATLADMQQNEFYRDFIEVRYSEV
ncbi:MAG: ribosomal-processing cysteine protease Prp [Eubacteriales bacterium]|jgi:uncharacterized protein YsxB (DUF464 family)